MTQRSSYVTAAAHWQGTPLLLVLTLSIVVAAIMLLFFGRFSNQKKLKRAKARLQAHLLAVRLFQDQLRVVLQSYPRILAGIGNYLRYALKPAAMLFVPLVALTVVLDPYFGYQPLTANHNFLITAQADNPQVLDSVALQLPDGLRETAPAVHIAADNQVVWRVAAARDGHYTVTINAGGQTYTKQVVVSNGMARVTTGRWRGAFWDHLFDASESPLPQAAPLSAIEVGYDPRLLNLGIVQWNWIVVLFFAAIVAALAMKKAFRVEI